MVEASAGTTVTNGSAGGQTVSPCHGIPNAIDDLPCAVTEMARITTLAYAPSMSDPLSLFPIAVAAGGGLIDGVETRRLVAAGLTLLQRSAPLVRALAGRRSALLLPTGPQFLTALSASDGRGAVLLNVLAAPSEIAAQLTDANVGAVFTLAAMAERLPGDCPRVLLDDAPHAARVMIAGRSLDVDLGSHHGLALEGRLDAPGLDEECAVVYTSAMAGRARGARLSHRNLIANARSIVEAMGLTPLDHALAVLPFSHLFGLAVSAAAPLMSGSRDDDDAPGGGGARTHRTGRRDRWLASGGVAALVQAMEARHRHVEALVAHLHLRRRAARWPCKSDLPISPGWSCVRVRTDGGGACGTGERLSRPNRRARWVGDTPCRSHDSRSGDQPAEPTGKSACAAATCSRDVNDAADGLAVRRGSCTQVMRASWTLMHHHVSRASDVHAQRLQYLSASSSA
jgi:hypothetical protein